MQAGTSGAGWAGLLTEAKMAARDTAEVGILMPELFTRTVLLSRSTMSLLVLRKSAPRSGNWTAALRNGHVNSWPPNLTVLVDEPQQRIGEPPAPRRGGPRAGADDSCGMTE